MKNSSPQRFESLKEQPDNRKNSAELERKSPEEQEQKGNPFIGKKSKSRWNELRVTEVARENTFKRQEDREERTSHRARRSYFRRDRGEPKKEKKPVFNLDSATQNNDFPSLGEVYSK